MLKDILSWESLSFLVFGVVAGALYYHFVLEPRDEKLHATMECMDDLHSKVEYDRCVQLLKK